VVRLHRLGFLAVTMAKLFFPTSDLVASLLLTFAASDSVSGQAAGALSWWVPMPIVEAQGGARADSHAVMIGTLMMAVTPTYASIGPGRRWWW